MGIRLKRNSDRITYDDSSANIVDGAIASNLQSAIAAIDARLDTIETIKQKTLLSTLTNFYVNGVNGVDGNNGTNTPFKSLLYCLIYIRDNYIIDSSINIYLLSDDRSIDGFLTLRGFEVGVQNSSYYLNIYGNNNKLIISSGVSIRCFNIDLVFNFQNLNIEPDNLDFSTSVQIFDSIGVQFVDCKFKQANLNFFKCQRVSLYSSLFEKGNLEFNQCIDPAFGGIELRDGGYLKFIDCNSSFNNFSLGSLVISGTISIHNNHKYIEFVRCNGINWSGAVTLNTSSLSGTLLEIRDCLSLDLGFTLFNGTGGDINFTPLVFNTSRCPVAVFNSEDIILRQGSDTKFIISPDNKGLLVDNTSEVVVGTDSRSALNLPIYDVVNSIGTEAFVNGSNFRSITGLTQTTQSAALDELALKNKTIRLTIDSNLQLENNSPAIQNIENLTGNSLNISLPLAPFTDKNFMIINRSSSTGNLLINSTTVLPGEKYALIFDSVSWLEW